MQDAPGAAKTTFYDTLTDRQSGFVNTDPLHRTGPCCGTDTKIQLPSSFSSAQHYSLGRLRAWSRGRSNPWHHSA